MNIKALITTLVLGSSSMASADSLKFSGSVKVSLGNSTHASSSARAHNHYNQERRPYRPVARRVLPQHRPVLEQYYNPQNTYLSANRSVYSGWIATSPTTSMPSVYDHSYRVSNRGWFDLTAPTRIDAGREDFLLGANKGLFRALKLEALGAGASQIQWVSIHLINADGTKRAQVVQLNTKLDRYNPSLTIDLDGGFTAIDKILVSGSTDRGAAFKIRAL